MNHKMTININAINNNFLFSIFFKLLLIIYFDETHTIFYGGLRFEMRALTQSCVCS